MTSNHLVLRLGDIVEMRTATGTIRAVYLATHGREVYVRFPGMPCLHDDEKADHRTFYASAFARCFVRRVK